MEHVEFPRFMCRAGGSWELETGKYSVQMVPDKSALDEAWANGWRFDQYAARDAVNMQAPATLPASEALTRAELEAKAKELGLTYHHKTGDKKLAELIAAKVAP